MICGSHRPSIACLDDIGSRAALIAGRKAWGGHHIYTLINDYDPKRYPITDELLRAVLALAGQEATNGKLVVRVYASRVRPWSVILLRSRKCKRPSCHIHFVGLGAYCSNKCRALYTKHLRKLAAQRRRQAELLRRRKAQRNRKVKRG